MLLTQPKWWLYLVSPSDCHRDTSYYQWQRPLHSVAKSLEDTEEGKWCKSVSRLRIRGVGQVSLQHAEHRGAQAHQEIWTPTCLEALHRFKKAWGKVSQWRELFLVLKISVSTKMKWEYPFSPCDACNFSGRAKELTNEWQKESVRRVLVKRVKGYIYLAEIPLNPTSGAAAW